MDFGHFPTVPHAGVVFEDRYNQMREIDRISGYPQIFRLKLVLSTSEVGLISEILSYRQIRILVTLSINALYPMLSVTNK